MMYIFFLLRLQSYMLFFEIKENTTSKDDTFPLPRCWMIPFISSCEEEGGEARDVDIRLHADDD